jgi:DASH complex subunit DAM1
VLEPAFSELSDAMADLEANMMHLQLLQSSISRFNENFGAFLYGMNMTAFCVDFPEAPIAPSYARHHHHDGRDPLDDSPFHYGEQQQQQQQKRMMMMDEDRDREATFMTSDTSGFVENPPPTEAKKGKFTEVPGSTARPGVYNARGKAAPGRGSAAPGAGRGTSGGRGRGGSGIARGTSSRGGIARGTGIARGVSRGRGVK